MIGLLPTQQRGSIRRHFALEDLFLKVLRRPPGCYLVVEADQESLFLWSTREADDT
jgi:hypothetical protein